MTIIYRPNVSITLGSYDGIRQFLFEIIDFLRSIGWTIPLSSDGSSGGVGDFIVDRNDLAQYTASTSRSWVVLRTPNGGKDLQWGRGNTNQGQYYFYTSPSGSYSGGNAWDIPTASDGRTNHWTTDICGFAPMMLHMAADDAPPYGWYAWCHASGSFGTRKGGYAMWPIDTAQPGDDDPTVLGFGLNDQGIGTKYELTEETTDGATPRCMATIPGQNGSYQNCPALEGRSEGTAFPGGLEADENGDDLSFPVLFARRNALGTGGYKGLSTFLQWNGKSRGAGELFASKTRISIGDVNVPWDPTVLPKMS